MGPCTASSCCCQAPNLPWAPDRLLMLLPGPECVHVSLYASHCCCLHRHTLPCATFSLLTLLVGSIFCHRSVWPPIAAASTATLWLHTLVLAP
ncbi:unnamed protein product [Staurois parvus]|uniref:Uncharacterized protein n=1 Tax=Staurois parvus TaxID=386267 RepID=A0ABN9HEB8_9NEOB|nr:unnamed protein product [Staurois parvus]